MNKNFKVLTEFCLLESDYDILTSLLKNNKILLNTRTDIGARIREKRPQEALDFFMNQVKNQLATIKPRVSFSNSFWEDLEFFLKQIRAIYISVLDIPEEYQTFKTRILKRHPRRTRLRRIL